MPQGARRQRQRQRPLFPWGVKERLVRFRVLVGANPEGAGSVIAIFAIYAPFRTGFSTSERNERAVPRDHPAMGMVRTMRDAIARSVGM